MVRGKNTKGMVILLLFLAATLTNAAPTISSHETDSFVCALSASSNTYSNYRPDISQTAEIYNSHLASIYAELRKPPVSLTIPPSPHISVKSLPNVPGTLLMVLEGFLCISLIKDRRIWLAALVRLLRLGQAGFTALPQMALYLASRKQTVQKSIFNVSGLCKPEQPCRPRSDLEGTFYIGLLHHLAGIPESITSLSFAVSLLSLLMQRAFSLLWNRSQSNLKTLCYYLSFTQIKEKSQAPQLAVIKTSFCPIQVTNFLAFGDGQPVHLSPVFIFTHIARGPPYQV